MVKSVMRYSINNVLIAGALVMVAVMMVMGYSSKYLLTDSHESHDKKVAHPAPKPNSSHVLPAHSLDLGVHARSLPNFNIFPIGERKQQFIVFLLPLILEANDEIEQRRQQIIKAYRRNDLGRLIEWGKVYDYETEAPSTAKLYEELMKRVAPVPVSIALAQSAIESGWGTSRFAQQGNALYGQWAWRQEDGLKPLERNIDDGWVVRSFDTPFESVRSYMNNLNSHPAYEQFRVLRTKNNHRDESERIKTLVTTLSRYATKPDYPEIILAVIEENNLLGYEKIAGAHEYLDVSSTASYGWTNCLPNQCHRPVFLLLSL